MPNAVSFSDLFDPSAFSQSGGQDPLMGQTPKPRRPAAFTGYCFCAPAVDVSYDVHTDFPAAKIIISGTQLGLVH